LLRHFYYTSRVTFSPGCGSLLGNKYIAGNSLPLDKKRDRLLISPVNRKLEEIKYLLCPYRKHIKKFSQP
jgi:hypothetical protein